MGLAAKIGPSGVVFGGSGRLTEQALETGSMDNRTFARDTDVGELDRRATRRLTGGSGGDVRDARQCEVVGVARMMVARETSLSSVKEAEWDTFAARCHGSMRVARAALAAWAVKNSTALSPAAVRDLREYRRR